MDVYSGNTNEVNNMNLIKDKNVKIYDKYLKGNAYKEV